MVGAIIGNFKVVSVLGEGGMGTVYKAFDMTLERFVALKVLSAQAASNAQFVERFKREAKNQAKLTHPNIVPVYGFTDENGVRAIVMEYVEGETIEKMIDRKKKLEYIESLLMLQQVLAGVGYAHSKGFIHRDIKPSNIILSTEGIIKIMDFGISKAIFDKGITKTGTKIGTVLYMSPEQIRAEEPTKQSDIYSIGVTFYEMLAGKPPFNYDTDYEIMEGHLKKSVPRVSLESNSVPPEIDKVVARALDKSIYKRYKNCEEFAEDVNNILYKYDHIEAKPEEKKTEKSAVIQKSKIGIYFTIAFAVFLLALYFSFNIVRKFWTEYKTIQRNSSADTTLNYKANPNYIVRSNWAQMKTGVDKNLNSIFFTDSFIGFACGEKGLLIKTNDKGAAWKQIVISDTCNFNDIAFCSLNTGIIIGENGKIYRTNNIGETWQEIYAGVTENLFKVHFVNKFVGFIVGSKGLILKTNDSGLTWSRVNSNTSSLLYGICFADEDNGIAVGWGGTCLKTTDQGNEWHVLPSFTTDYMRDVFFINKTDGIICGAGGNIFQTKDGGNTWKKIDSKVYSGLLSIGFINSQTGYITSMKGEILLTNDGGDSWQVTQSGNYFSLSRISITPAEDAFVSGLSGSVLKLNRD
jgi:serine/threonine-protein kinase